MPSFASSSCTASSTIVRAAHSTHHTRMTLEEVEVEVEVKMVVVEMKGPVLSLSLERRTVGTDGKHEERGNMWKRGGRGGGGEEEDTAGVEGYAAKAMR